MRRKRLRRLALMYPSISLGYPFVPLKIKSNYTLKDYQARQSFFALYLSFQQFFELHKTLGTTYATKTYFQRNEETNKSLVKTARQLFYFQNLRFVKIITCKIRKGVPRSKAKAEGDWNTSTAKRQSNIVNYNEISNAKGTPKSLRTKYAQLSQE